MDVIQLIRSYDIYSDRHGNVIEVQKYCDGGHPCKHKVRVDIKHLTWWGWYKGVKPIVGHLHLYCDQIETLFDAAGLQVPYHFKGSRKNYSSLSKRLGRHNLNQWDHAICK